MLRKLIKEKIKKQSNLRDFADAHGIHRATLYDFLNGKKDITLSTFLKLVEPLDIDICDKLPDGLIKVDNISFDGIELSKGMTYKDGVVLALFDSDNTSHKFALIEKDEQLILVGCGG